MEDHNVYKYTAIWTLHIDNLLASGLKREEIENAFHELAMERESMRFGDEAKRKIAAITEQYMKDRYGKAAERNYKKEDYDVFAASVLKDIDDNMAEVLALEDEGYRKVDTKGKRYSADCTPDEVLADFVKNL